MSGPCEGLRVIDFSNTFPGALATIVLADAGADVKLCTNTSAPATRSCLRRGSIWTFPRTPAAAGPISYIGEHAKPILGELGYDDETLLAWRATGIVTWPNGS